MRAALAAAGLAVVLGGCGGDEPSAAPEPSTSAPAVAASGQPRLPTVPARVGGVPLEVELATTPEQKAAGLRDREVPPGTGMAFLYPVPRTVRFTMSGVERPLVAVFVRDGRAVRVEQLVPCAGTVQECPSYGPAEPVDLVVEAAPESLPDARPGDEVVLER